MFQKNTSKPKYLKSQDSSHLFKHINKSRWYLINLNLNSLNMKFVLHTYYSTLHFRCLGYGKNKISIWCWENREIPFGVGKLYVAHYNLGSLQLGYRDREVLYLWGKFASYRTFFFFSDNKEFFIIIIRVI